MTWSFYERLYPVIVRGQTRILIGVALIVALSVFSLAGLPLNMSFRPFVADDKDAVAATEDFERVFGQRSGAYIGAIIERDDILTAAFLRRLSQLSKEVESIDGVSEARSLARMPVSVWDMENAHGEWLLDDDRLGKERLLDIMLPGIANDSRVQSVVLSEDRRHTLLLARVSLPLQDLRGRQPVIDKFRSLVETGMGEETPLHFFGLSVVEDGYSTIVLVSLARSLAFTMMALVIVLWIIFRRFSGVLIAMLGVSLATPVTLGVMRLIGQELTMVNSMVPIVVLIIGVADAIHMQQSFYINWKTLTDRRDAARAMFARMGAPCLLATLTTAAGFLALRVADVRAIRDFGLNVGIGIVIVYIFNLVLIPILLNRLPDHRLATSSSNHRWLDRWLGWSARVVTEKTSRVVALFALLIAVFVLSLPGLKLDQRFNEEVSPLHPLRIAQDLLETKFRGFLGPDLRIRLRDGSSLVTTDTRRRISALQTEIDTLDGVTSVESFLDHLTPIMTDATASEGLAVLREDPLVGRQIEDLLNGDQTQAAILIRIRDMGTHRADAFLADLHELIAKHLGNNFEVDVVGQWWLAHLGMRSVVRDMVVSFIVSSLVILPLFWLILRHKRLFLISIIPNLLPMLAALAIASLLGIPIRIGTAMILAVALGIAIDDTIHFMVRFKTELATSSTPQEAVNTTLTETGGAIFYTSVVLILGFLSMLSNDLLVIRDMGVVAAATLAVAFLADVYLAPALYLLTSRIRSGTS